MQASDFANNMSGQLVKTLDGQLAFIPAPLPPKLSWDAELISLLSAADRAVGKLAGIGSGDLSGFNPTLLIRPFARREAVLSSRIEGTRASLSQLFLFEEGDPVEQDVPDVREVANYVRALERGVEALKHRPIGVALLKDLHQVLMTGVRGGDKTPGAFRQIQVFIGATSQMADARFVPPPPLEVPPLMTDFERYLRAPAAEPPLVRIALAHYHFEAVHPFQDGNGRIGRLLVTLLLCMDGLLPLPVLYLSAYLERHRQAYYDHLLAVSQRGAWREWIAFFLRGVASEANDAIARAGRLMRLRDEYRAQLRDARAPLAALKLVDELFATPAITVKRAAAVTGLAITSASAHIERLAKSGLLAEMTGQKRNRVYLATGILRALDDESGDASTSSR